MLVVVEFVFKLFPKRLPTTRNNMQQGVRTDATCKLQQCWEFLANNVASACTELYQISNLVPRVLSVLLVPTKRETEGREGERTWGKGCQLADSQNFRKFRMIPLLGISLGTSLKILRATRSSRS